MRPSTPGSAADRVSDDRLLELIGATIGLLDVDEFHTGLVHVLRRVVAADRVSVNDVRPEPESTAVVTDPPAPSGVEHQIAFTLPHTQDRSLRVVLTRRTHDFTHAERDLLRLARPFLIQAYRNSVRFAELLDSREGGHVSAGMPGLEQLCALGLTDRQAEVLQLLSTGAAERDIGDKLGISHRTVQKHLQRCYRQLGVTNRSRAAAIAWSTTGRGV